jgi:hypothetical protein
MQDAGLACILQNKIKVEVANLLRGLWRLLEPKMMSYNQNLLEI